MHLLVSWNFWSTNFHESVSLFNHYSILRKKIQWQILKEKKSVWLACSAGVFWVGESCLFISHIAVTTIFDFKMEEDQGE